MQELRGNLFDYVGKVDAICITTNGFVKANGECVMGKGCAKEATNRWPGISSVLGSKIRSHGNIPHILITAGITHVVSFPVKPISELFDGTNAVRHMLNKFKFNDVVPGWACKARIEVIQHSAAQLKTMVDTMRWVSVIIPQPGCGAGELNWVYVKPILEQYLDDRFYSITF